MALPIILAVCTIASTAVGAGTTIWGIVDGKKAADKAMDDQDNAADDNAKTKVDNGQIASAENSPTYY